MLKKITSSSFKDYIPFIVIFFVTLATRIAVMGNPFVDFDETFYLFTGGRILHGELPYIDVWDRKPIGIFLIYAVFHLFGAWRILAYQIGSFLCVLATALLIVRTARLIASAGGALFAAVLYCVWIIFAHGEGGQTPIFYNALVTYAMMLLAYRFPTMWSRQKGRVTGVWVMALFGLAIQIKYTAVFEGIYAGIFLLWSAYKAKRAWVHLITDAFIWIVTALAPTIAAFLFYAYIGHAHDWWFANFQSIFLRSFPPSTRNTVWMGIIGALMLVSIPLRSILNIHVERSRKSQSTFLTGWALSALIGVALFGTYIRHYSLSLYAPFFIIAAPLWQKKIGKLWLIGLFVFASVKGYGVEKKVIIKNSHHEFREMLRTISSPVGCLFEYDGPAILLDTPSYCPVTTSYPFPGHLRLVGEKNALGVDPIKETQKILKSKPLYIIANHHDRQSNSNYDVDHLVYTTLQQNYVPVYEHIIDKTDNDAVIIYKLKDQ